MDTGEDAFERKVKVEEGRREVEADLVELLSEGV